jgi:preprotein translocase subunit SecG
VTGNRLYRNAPNPYNRLFQLTPQELGESVVTLLAVAWYVHLLNIVVLTMGGLLILLILIQRGKGGGLVGAFGGAGGSSPFGSRAGDTFTKITLGFALVWALLIVAEVKVVQHAGKAAMKVNR